MKTIDILETACFPKGCMFDENLQLILATELVPKLRDAGMTPSEWTRGAALLEEPHLTQVKSIVCKGCRQTLCPHNSKYSSSA